MPHCNKTAILLGLVWTVFWASGASQAARAQTADQSAARERAAIVGILGYDPEARPISECAQRASQVRLLRASLNTNRPRHEIAEVYFPLAGLTGAAREVCSADRAPEPVMPLRSGSTGWDARSCNAAADAVLNAVSNYLDKQDALKHPDLRAGFATGLLGVLTPTTDACTSHDAWAKLEMLRISLRGREAAHRAGRICDVWSNAAEAELYRALDMAKAKGGSAGLALYRDRALVALAAAKSRCPDNFVFRNQLLRFQTMKGLIELQPEKP